MPSRAVAVKGDGEAAGSSQAPRRETPVRRTRSWLEFYGHALSAPLNPPLGLAPAPGPGSAHQGRAAVYDPVVMKVFCTCGSGTMVSALATGRSDCTLPLVPLLVTRPA